MHKTCVPQTTKQCWRKLRSLIKMEGYTIVYVLDDTYYIYVNCPQIDVDST